MRFLSDILAKAGLIVDGAAVFNSSATGQTPATNDNSTKFATTAWVRSFVQPYTLPIASSTVLGGIKVGTGLAIDALTGVLSVSGGSITLKSTQTFTATEGQSIFTITNGYTTGLIDVFLNGVYLSPGQTTATNGSTVTLADPAIAGDIIDVIITSPIGQGSVATTDNLPEGTVNLYYTPARVRTAISLTTTGVSGAATYNNLTGVFNIPNYQGLVPANGLAGQILAKASTTSYDTTWIDNYTSQVQHYVKLGEAMTAGTPVYVSGSTGNAGTNMIVSKSSNSAEATSSKTLGLLATGGAANDIVFVITEGLLSGLNTNGATAGDPVWLGPNGTLLYGLTNKPVAPAHLVFIGVVTRAQQNNGEIFVKVQNGFELDELHDLSVKNASDGDMIKYVASTGLWTKIAASTTNIVEGTNLYYTAARVAAYLTANSYATQGYVNTAISNLVASAPTTLDTLNELATALGNDPNFATTIATSIGTKVPQTRTITINGTAYDLSADRSWSIAGGVTSFNTRTGAITLTNTDVSTALGYIPYSSLNPSGYITSSALSTYLPLSGGTLTGALSGTSATFSQAVTVTTLGNDGLVILGRSDNYAIQRFKSANGVTTYATIYSPASGVLRFESNGVQGLELGTTGAATFSSSVTATQIGLGVSALPAWTGAKAIQAGLAGSFYGDGLVYGWQTGMAANAYRTGATTWAYNNTGVVAARVEMSEINPFAVFGAPTGTAGNAITFTPLLTISPSGNVGIGTTSPTNYGTSYTTLDLYNATAGGYFVARGPNVTMQLGVETTVAIIGPTTSHPLLFQTAGAERMRLLSDGPLSFSTIATVPTYNNSIYSTSANGYMYIQGGTTGLALTGSGNRNNGIYIISTLNAIAFHTNNQGERVRITDTGFLGINTTNPLAPLHVNGDIRTTGLRLNQGTNNQGHRIYSRTMDVSAYSSQTSMRFTVAGGNNVQFQYEVTFHATRLSGTLAEIWYLRYTGGIAYDTAGNPNERWWDLREQAGNGIAGVGRNNNTGNLEITNSAFDTSCRLTVCVKITCNNWDAVTVSFS
jgi:hypothetical protein